MITMMDRYFGAMLGTGVGDAIAARYENKKRADIEQLLVEHGGLKMADYIDPWRGVRHMKAGQPTDDSELAAALGLSLVEFPMFNPEDAYNRLRSFIHDRKSVLTNERAYGSGGTLRRALEPATYAESLAKFYRGEVPIIPTNGSLMRCIGIPLAYHGNFDLLFEHAHGQSIITHRHEHATAACIAFSFMVSHLLNGLAPDQAWHSTCGSFGDVNGGMRDVLRLSITEPTEEEMWPHTGSVLLSLRIALWATITAKDFRDGIEKCVRVGGDTDTYGAIAGGMLGAHFGHQGIPAEWIDVLQGRRTLAIIANRLCCRSVFAS